MAFLYESVAFSPASLSITVTDADTRLPIPDAEVLVWKGDTLVIEPQPPETAHYRKFTDANGIAEFTDLEVGFWYMWAIVAYGYKAYDPHYIAAGWETVYSYCRTGTYLSRSKSYTDYLVKGEPSPAGPVIPPPLVAIPLMNAKSALLVGGLSAISLIELGSLAVRRR